MQKEETALRERRKLPIGRDRRDGWAGFTTEIWGLFEGLRSLL